MEAPQHGWGSTTCHFYEPEQLPHKRDLNKLSLADMYARLVAW